MRYPYVLAHHYFATHPEIIQATIDKDLDPLELAVIRMRGRIESDKPGNPGSLRGLARQSVSPR